MKDFEVKEWVKCGIYKDPSDNVVFSVPYFVCMSVYDEDGVFKEIDGWLDEGVYDEFKAYDLGYGVDFFVEVLGFNGAQVGFEGRVEIDAYYDLKFTVIASDYFEEIRSMNKC